MIKGIWRFIRPRFKDPRLRSFLRVPISPPPGYNLTAPEDWEPEKYLKKIGGDTSEFSDKFETVQEILDAKRKQLKAKGIPTRQRKYILRVNEYMRRGVLSFPHLEKRTALPRKDDD